MRWAIGTMQVYLAGPITGFAHEDREEWREKLQSELRYKYGIVAVMPQAAQKYATTYGISNPAPVLTQRDKWMCTKSDVVLANFSGAEKPSIGTCIEIGWASQAGVPIIAVIPLNSNPHNHAMILSLCDFVVGSLDEAVGILRGLNGGL